ncbi:MAG TPA: SDR family oxidoreductase [Dehalococcoidia bacterium]|jgi:NAD(P)-dependent dehydrogenase (short-subunit alcohol dehydrogenase family)|nr:SDR family oxidoreductase [Dehalococcoidia bacterium]
MASFDLTDRVAIVTGGSDGIGKGIALGMAEAGAHIVVAARRQDRIDATVAQLQGMGRRSLGVPTDVSQPEQVENLIDATMKEFGRIDILVNNAGSSWGSNFKRGTLLELDASDFDGAFGTNVKSQFLCGRAAVPIMQQQATGGAIINMSSVAGQLNLTPSPTMGLYSATKAAILSFTRTMAAEWAPKVRVNALMPGLIQTDRTRNDPNRKATDDELAANIGLARVGMPSDVAGAAVFLASDAASWITGAAIQIDGGPKPRV